MRRRVSQPAVLVIDAGLGNIGSAVAALERQACTVKRLAGPPDLPAMRGFSHVVLPGVGSFAAGMEALRQRGWADWLLQQWCPTGRPLLGICLGMQLLASRGSEGAASVGAATTGLGLIPGSVERIHPDGALPLPHVGWNAVDWQISAGPLSKGLPPGGDFYFVHSYAFTPANSSHALASADYGGMFTAVVGRAACYGVQFHPEKSQRLGRQLLSNFLALGPC
ncbi:MAG: imidazole glycerol phosphate synthase subunit HisH [Synechococcaceae bacterium WB9_2_170]|nr:imidazole glycerol phosphate synthase subunit HisH [Synechococcaceae bacterium WB9_2_170]